MTKIKSAHELATDIYELPDSSTTNIISWTAEIIAKAQAEAWEAGREAALNAIMHDSDWTIVSALLNPFKESKSDE